MTNKMFLGNPPFGGGGEVGVAGLGTGWVPKGGGLLYIFVGGTIDETGSGIKYSLMVSYLRE